MKNYVLAHLKELEMLTYEENNPKAAMMQFNVLHGQLKSELRNLERAAAFLKRLDELSALMAKIRGMHGWAKGDRYPLNNFNHIRADAIRKCKELAQILTEMEQK